MIPSKSPARVEKYFRLVLFALVFSASSVYMASGQAVGPIGADFFGMSVNDVPAAPWPSTLGVPFASFRTLGVTVKWSDIEKCDGGSDPTNSCYVWTNFDSWMSQAETTGKDILYTVYSTTTWASSQPNDTSCVRGTSFPAGSCDAPNDIDAVLGSGLGDGTNKHYQDFLTAVLNHIGPGKIKYWEVWDEPNVAHAWKGTPAQLVRLAKDTNTVVKALDSNALTTTPPYVGKGIRTPFQNYLQAGGGQYADVIAYHGYLQTGTCPSNCPIPENEAVQIGVVQSVMQITGQTGKPIFDTEGSWGNYLGADTIPDPDQQVAFTARYYLMHLSNGVSKVYWYSWNNQENGHFYDIPNAVITPAGTAYEQLYNWLVGATLTSPCTIINTQWSCSFTGSWSGSNVAETIWDVNSSYICSSGVCPTVNVAVPTHYTHYQDLAGDLTAISNHTVPVGSKPVLVEGTTPQISVTESASPTVAVPGGTISYTTTIKNNTASAISTVSVVDNLDPSLTFASCSSTPHGLCQNTTSSATVNFSSLASGETDTITITVNVGSSAVATIVNTATANWGSGSSNNWASVAVPVGTPVASVKPTSINFGNQTIHATSTVKNVVVSNTVTGNLVLNNIGTTGTNSADFSFTSSPLPITVAPQGKATIGVQFTPSGLGSRTGSLYIYDDINNGTLLVGLAGNGANPTTTKLTSSVNPALFGQNVTFTATVACSSFNPTGTVSFNKGSTVLGAGNLNSAGVATFSTSTLPVGWQTITAVYSSDANCGSSSGSTPEAVKLPSSVTLSSTLNPSNFGQSVTFHANVSSSAGGIPSGTILFKDGTVKLTSTTLDGAGNASFTISTLKVGTHSITASYQGNTKYMAGNSPVVSQTVH